MAHTSKRKPPDQTPTMMSLCSGTTCIGHLLSRGRDGFELFDHDDKTLGVYADLHAAVAAIPRTGEERS